MHELFIYYRIRADAEAAALQAAQAMQVRLRDEHPGLTARLLRRPGNDDPQPTWMEIYALHRDGEPAGITPPLQACIEQAAADALGPYLAGPRHIEVFVPCAS